MLEKIIAAVTDLPVLIQGALGSALFALVMVLGQRLAAFIALKLTATSRKRRKRFLIEEILKYNVLSTNDYATRGAFVLLLLYRASRSLFKALIWLTLGLIFSAANPVLGLVGFLGCLYYLFAALNTVRAPEQVEDVEAKLEALKTQKAQIEDA